MTNTEDQRAGVERVAQLLSSAKRVLFITGAGLSADSGLPTYRGVGGLYDGVKTPDGMRIEDVLSGATFRRKPELTWRYLLQVERACRGATFNAGHRVIAALGRRLPYVLVLTQNVDGFHQRAGSERVVDIHGSLHDLYCTRCGARRRVQSYAGLPELPRCASCGGIERPDVVLFGENLPEAKVNAVLRELGTGFDAVLSVGTSGLFPYIRMPMIRAQVLGWHSVDINPAASEMSDYAQHHLRLRAAEALEALWERMERGR
jgi:NAD-dependent deacetylase